MPDLPVSEALQTPILVPLSSNLYLIRFTESKKVVAARGVARQAWRHGELHEDSHVFVSSSGNFGLGWAVVTRELDLSMTLVTQPTIQPLLSVFKGMGVDVCVIEEPDPEGGYQQARLDRLNSLAADHPHSFVPHPYDDPRIVTAYEPVANSVIEVQGYVPDVVVDVTGSGGSLMGFARAFRETHAVAVDTYGSCLFGREAGERGVSGMGNSVVPEILDHTEIDQVHWMPTQQVHAAARALLREHGLFMGPTTGAAVRAGKWVARRNPQQDVVCIGADSGWRYKDSTFNPSQPEGSSEVNALPRQVDYPREASQDDWCYMDWRRRTPEEVLKR